MRGRTLVSVEHGRTVVAVVRDGRGDLSLDDDRYGGTRVAGHRPAVQGLEADVTVTGGRLPEGAVRAIVQDRAGRAHDAVVGEQAWLAVLPEPVRGESPVVRFLDAAGELVAVPLPAGVELAPVEDAREPCPACRAADWGRVVVAPPGRSGSDGAGRPTAAVCRRCGHEESLGVLSGPSIAGIEVDADEIAQARGQFARDFADVARSVPFALYGLARHRGTAVGHGGQDGRVDTVTLAFTTASGEVRVETSTAEPFEPAGWVARHALEGLLHEDDARWPDASETAVSLWLNARSRAHAAAATAAPVRELSLRVAGTWEPFATVAHDDRFAAVARLPEATVTITGAGDPAQLELQTVAADDLAA
jgi:hypothetical protein